MCKICVSSRSVFTAFHPDGLDILHCCEENASSQAPLTSDVLEMLIDILILIEFQCFTIFNQTLLIPPTVAVRWFAPLLLLITSWFKTDRRKNKSFFHSFSLCWEVKPTSVCFLSNFRKGNHRQTLLAGGCSNKPLSLGLQTNASTCLGWAGEFLITAFVDLRKRVVASSVTGAPSESSFARQVNCFWSVPQNWN